MRGEDLEEVEEIVSDKRLTARQADMATDRL